MPTFLDRKSLDALEINLKEQGRLSYYSRLLDLGYEEARLSRFVVTNTELIGRFSNRYAEAVSVQKNLCFEASEWAAIGEALAHDDWKAREKRLIKRIADAKLRGEPIPTSFDVSLGYSEYRSYHADVFNRWIRPNIYNAPVPLGKEAWSLEIVIGDAEETLVAPLWRRMVDVEEYCVDQVFAVCRVVVDALRNGRRPLGQRLKAVAAAFNTGFGPFLDSLERDTNFYKQERIRPKPKVEMP